jgi:hypothetical protein
MKSDLSSKWILGCTFALTLLCQWVVTADTAYLDSDDWFIVRMGREVVDTPPTDLSEPLTRFWTEEPTWRPLSVLLSGLEHAILGDNPRYRVGFHGLLHLACAWMIFLLASRWLQSSQVGAWSAILYTVHPIHGETLAWFHSGFEAVPITLMILITLWLFTTQRRTWLVLLSFQAALFFRENAICIPFLITAIAASRAAPKSRWREILTVSGPYWIVLAINAIGRIVVLKNTMNNDASMLQSFHITGDLWGSILHVLAQPWFPVHPSVWASTAWFVLFAVLGAALVVLHWQVGTRRQLGIVWGFFLLTCLPVALQLHDAAIFHDAISGDHDQRWYFFHLPIAALMTWAAALLVHKQRWGTPILVGLAGLFLVLQVLHMRWWTERGRLVTSIENTIELAVRETPDSAIGIVLKTQSASADLVEQAVLNRAIRLLRSPQDVPVFRVLMLSGGSPNDRAMSAVNSHGELLWHAAPASPPRPIQWLEWNEVDQNLVMIEVDPTQWPGLVPSNNRGNTTHDLTWSH